MCYCSPAMVFGKSGLESRCGAARPSQTDEAQQASLGRWNTWGLLAVPVDPELCNLPRARQHSSSGTIDYFPSWEGLAGCRPCWTSQGPPDQGTRLLKPALRGNRRSRGRKDFDFAAQCGCGVVAVVALRSPWLIYFLCVAFKEPCLLGMNIDAARPSVMKPIWPCLVAPWRGVPGSTVLRPPALTLRRAQRWWSAASARWEVSRALFINPINAAKETTRRQLTSCQSGIFSIPTSLDRGPSGASASCTCVLNDTIRRYSVAIRWSIERT